MAPLGRRIIVQLLPFFAQIAFAILQCSPVPPPSGSGIICGKKGTAQLGPSATFKSSLADCVRTIDRQLGTRFTFSYDPSSETCGNYTSNSLSAIGFRPNSRSAVQFYDYRCYQCQQVCPESTSTPNAVLNPGFEYSNTSIVPWSLYPFNPPPTFVIAHPGGYNKSANAVGEGTPPQGGFQLLQNVSTCPDSVYLVTYSYRLKGPYNPAVVGGTFGDGHVTITFAGVNDTGWRTFTGSFAHTASKSASVGANYDLFNPSSVLFHGLSRSRTRFDDMHMSVLPSPIPTASGAPNQIQNPGLENSNTSIAPWNAKRGASLGSPGYGGSKHSLHLVPRMRNAGNAQTYQIFNATAGTTCVFGFVYKFANGVSFGDDPYGTPLLVSLSSVDGSASADWLGFLPGTPGPGGWYTFERVYVATSTQFFVELTSSLEMFIDNFVFTETSLVL